MIEIKDGLRLRLGKENVTVVDGKLKLDNPQQSIFVNALRSTGQEALYADVIRIKYDLNCIPLPLADQELELEDLTAEEAEILGVGAEWAEIPPKTAPDAGHVETGETEPDAETPAEAEPEHAGLDAYIEQRKNLRSEHLEKYKSLEKQEDAPVEDIAQEPAEEVVEEVVEEPTPEDALDSTTAPVVEEVADTPAAKPVGKKKNAKIDDLPQE